MIKSFGPYINELRDKLDKNLFSTSFVRLANLYFLNAQYEDCIGICKIGLELYPDYLTVKMLLLKSLIRLEYINEAESILSEIEERLSGLTIFDLFKRQIDDLKKSSRQERIYYTEKINSTVDFENYSKKIEELNKGKASLGISDLKNFAVDELSFKIADDKDFGDFIKDFGDFKFEVKNVSKEHNNSVKRVNVKTNGSSGSHLSKIKFVSETLADIFAKQGHFEEAFDTYNVLMQSENTNRKRILQKISDLERNLNKV